MRYGLFDHVVFEHYRELVSWIRSTDIGLRLGHGTALSPIQSAWTGSAKALCRRELDVFKSFESSINDPLGCYYDKSSYHFLRWRQLDGAQVYLKCATLRQNGGVAEVNDAHLSYGPGCSSGATRIGVRRTSCWKCTEGDHWTSWRRLRKAK